MSKSTYVCLVAVLVVMFDMQHMALAAGDSSKPLMKTDAAGNMHITSAPGQAVILNGVDVLGQIGELNATVIEAMRMCSSAGQTTPLPPTSPTTSPSTSPTTAPTTPPVPFTEQKQLFKPSPAANDYFGHSVNIDGGFSIVGIICDDSKAINAGAAAIHRFDGVSWVLEQLIYALDPAIGDYFGYAVAISDTTTIVGALFDDDKGSSSGSAYIHVRSGTSSDTTPWTQQQKLTASDGAANDWFGSDVDISNNICIVGAFFKDSSTGAAYIYLRVGTTWAEQQKVTASDAATGARFGRAVGISGTVAVVGADGNDDAGTTSGSAYVLETTNNGTSWTETNKIVASDAFSGDNFGLAVDVDNGVVVVGTRFDDDKVSGSAYIFTKSTSTNIWSQAAKITASDGEAGDYCMEEEHKYKNLGRRKRKEISQL